jgi:Virulence-associated protein E
MNAEPIAVSLLDDVFARSIRLESMTLEQLAELIRSVTKPCKPQLPLLKLSRFGSTAVPHTGSYRPDQNLVACSGIEGDYDGEVVSFDEALEKLIKANISAILCTSPSYAPERPRWRVICPFSTELPPSERPRMVGRLNGALHGVLAPESWTLSQAFYYGSVNDNPNHRVEIIDGDPIDLLSDLDLIAQSKPSGAGPMPNGHDRGGGPVDEGLLAQEIVSGTNYHVAGMRLIGLWAHQGVPLMEVERRLIELFDNVEEAKRDHRWRDRRADVERCVGDVFVKEAQKQDDADAELAAIQAAVAALVENDPGAAALIERIVAANLPPLVESPLIKTIKRLTAIGASAIDNTIKDAKQKLKRAVKAASQPTTTWAALVSRFESDEIRPTMSNVALVIRNEPSWNGTLGLDEFSLSITVQRPLPWDDPAKFRPRCWTDDDELAATEWMQRVAEIYSVPRTIVFDGVSRVADEHRFHPVRNYLDSLVWDSKPRTDNWLTYYLGAESADPRYLAAVGSRFLIQAVARIYKPGIKADCCLLIEGEQASENQWR